MDNNSRLIFYGAISVDGFLARENHALDWLIGTEGEHDTGYEEFYDSIDTILMGRKTYDQIQVLMEEFPYQDKKCYVFSRSTYGSTEHVEFIDEDIAAFTKALKKEAGRRIWIVGGGEVLYPLLQERMVDEFIIQVAPTIIGRGIPLFIPGETENQLKLLDVKQYKQFAELHYELA
ncbi:dihydrofolate reductase [Thalassobacillus devorans]|uniref:Dihydrofolate reductase n=1 Tax=Thalassobacillus devorans TaxID=279813 RepID=A0ABQ1NR19_9BACI|nr:dihydrofolate reductase family protein [Thalassobacillus devorans]NIK27469.1 dihydrofolate reductase [Thalassobacillus devorans]GGC77941.1 dihydrofolate reductase [Thalassobacillus devorans]